MGLYDNGASFQGSSLYVNNGNVVSNLNASKLQGKTPSDFINKDGETGLTQSGKIIGLNGVTMNASSSVMNFSGNINLDTTSEIKLGNLIIKSSDSGYGILIGTN